MKNEMTVLQNREANRARIRAIIASAGTRIHSVSFTKKNGDARTMVCQNAAMVSRMAGDSASESAKRAVKTRAKNHPNLLNVWEITSQGFRSINIDTVYGIAMDGIVYDLQRAGENKRIPEIVTLP